MRAQARPFAPANAEAAARPDPLFTELQHRVFEEAELATYAWSLRNQPLRKVYDAPGAHRRALLRAGLDRRWVEASTPDQLRRRLHVEAGWYAATHPLAHGGLMMLDPLGRGLQNRPHLHHAACDPSGENLAFFTEDDFRVHVVRLGEGPRRVAQLNFDLPHAQRPTATAFDACDRLFVATASGAVAAYALRSERPWGRPSPLGVLAPGRLAASAAPVALVSLAGGASLVGLQAGGLVTWPVGAEVAAAPKSYGSLQPTALQAPPNFAPFAQLAHAPETALLAASTTQGDTALYVGGEASLLYVASLPRPAAASPTAQALCVAEAGRCVARLDGASVALFDLRQSVRRASLRFAPLGRHGRPTVLAPTHERAGWAVGGASGEVAVFDARQLDHARWQRRLAGNAGPSGTGELTTLAPAPNGRALAAVVHDVPRSGRVRSELWAVPLDAAGEPMPPQSALVTTRERHRGLQWLVQGNRLLVHGDKTMLFWRPQTSHEVEQGGARPWAADAVGAQRVPVGPATERSAQRRSYASVVRHVRTAGGVPDGGVGEALGAGAEAYR